MIIYYVSKVIGGISISFYNHWVTFHLRKWGKADLKLLNPYHNVCVAWKQISSDLSHIVMIPTKDHVLEWFNTCFQTKPDHVWDSLIQFVLDLFELEVTAPIIIPEKQKLMLSNPKNLFTISFYAPLKSEIKEKYKMGMMRSHLGVWPLLKASFLSSSSLWELQKQ